PRSSTLVPQTALPHASWCQMRVCGTTDPPPATSTSLATSRYPPSVISFISRGLTSHHTGTVPLCSTSGATSSIDLTSMAQESGLRSRSMPTRTLEVQTPDGPMSVYEAVPDDGGRRGVVVIQEAFGVNDHIEDVTRRFADHGYHAVAPHLFHRAGGGTAPYGDFSKVLPL